MNVQDPAPPGFPTDAVREATDGGARPDGSRPVRPRVRSRWRHRATGTLHTVLATGTHAVTGEAVVLAADDRQQVVGRPLAVFLESFRPA